MLLSNRLGETGQTEAAVELVGRAKERLAGDKIDINTELLIIIILIMKWRLCAAFAHDVVLFLVQGRVQNSVARHRLQITYFSAHFFSGARLEIIKGASRDNCRAD